MYTFAFNNLDRTVFIVKLLRKIVEISFFILFIVLSQDLLHAIPTDRDLDGWTVFTPSVDSRIMYVSATGSDFTGQVYSRSNVGIDPTNPDILVNSFASYSAARAHSRDGYPDWILFRRGDIFITQLQPLSGRNDTEVAIIGSYGVSGDMPQIIPPDSSTPVLNNNDSLQHSAITSLDAYARFRDPSSPFFNGVAGSPGIVLRCGGSGTVNDFLIEGCRFRYFDGNEIQDLGSGSIYNTTIRRTVFLDNYSDGDGHCQGLYAYKTNGLTIEESIFDHNGWYSLSPGTPGEATVFNHNTYFEDNHNVKFLKNIFIRSSSIHNKFTANSGVGSSTNITIIDNLYLDGEVGIGLGGNVDGPRRFQNIVINGNVLTEIGRSQPTNRTLGWYIDLRGWYEGTVSDNYMIHNNNPEVSNVVGIGLHGYMENVLISKNYIYNIGGIGLFINDDGSIENISVDNFIVMDPNRGSHIVDARSNNSVAGISFSQNSYYSTVNPDFLFRVDYNGYTFEEWVNQTGDNSKYESYSYPDVSRCIESYQSHLGRTATIDAFISSCRNQGRFNWNYLYTAETVVPWLKQGFSIEDNYPPQYDDDGLGMPSGIRIEY